MGANTSELNTRGPGQLEQLLSKTRAFPVRLQKAFLEQTARVNPAPILILGNQKSGTSAIAALLAEMADLSVTIDLRKEIARPTYDRVLKGELSFARFVQTNKLDFSRDIVKEPNLTLLYRELDDYFPRARFVFVLRDPRDNIRSILNRLKIPGNLPQLTDQYRESLPTAWKLIVDMRWLGASGEHYIEWLAERWNLTTDVFLRYQDRMLLSTYEEFLQDKHDEIERLVQSLGLKPVKDIMSKINVQFQPAGNRNVKWLDFFGSANLDRIEQICAERMRLLNYQ